jgi:hypothetical protein
MQRFAAILFISYYSFGIFCLPLGDFSLLTQLPEMYQHCKATEDKDMNIVDFITDHLINIDGMFDKHQNGDDQKPHTPFPFHHVQDLGYSSHLLKQSLVQPVLHFCKPVTYKEDRYSSDYIFKIFHPPAV